MQRKVSKIVKSYSNGHQRWPVAWLELECGHTASAEFANIDDKVMRAHDDAAHLRKPGDELGCERCDWYAQRITELRAMRPGDISHSRFRTRDSRGIGAGDYYVYAYDAKSPTSCHLLFAIEATDEAGEELRRISASPLSPTERR
jgi:hypothetical protein